MKEMGKITSYLFGDSLLISLSKDWIDIFDALPKFSAEIKNEKLVLTSQKIKGDVED